jgi:hypothetical protein
LNRFNHFTILSAFSRKTTVCPQNAKVHLFDWHVACFCLVAVRACCTTASTSVALGTVCCRTVTVPLRFQPFCHHLHKTSNQSMPSKLAFREFKVLTRLMRNTVSQAILSCVDGMPPGVILGSHLREGHFSARQDLRAQLRLGSTPRNVWISFGGQLWKDEAAGSPLGGASPKTLEHIFVVRTFSTSLLLNSRFSILSTVKVCAKSIGRNKNMAL